MDYSIESIDLNDLRWSVKIAGLLTETFQTHVTVESLKRLTTTNSSTPSLYLGAVKGDELIGFNAFIPHDLEIGERVLCGLQSCWTATSSAHRGKKIFQNLINAGKDHLRNDGAAFIFGFPNDNSEFIFIQKLGFRKISSRKWQVPNFRLTLKRYVNELAEDSFIDPSKTITQNDRQLIHLKAKSHGDKLVAVEIDDGISWGVRREKEKFGLKIPYFELGGIFARSSSQVRALIAELHRRTNDAFYLQLTTSEGNYLEPSLNYLRPAQTNDLIVFDLNENTEDRKFSFFSGVKDVF